MYAQKKRQDFVFWPTMETWGVHFWTALINKILDVLLHFPFIPPTSANLEETPVSCLEQKKHVTVEIYQELYHWRLFSTLIMTPNNEVHLSF